jgi:AMP nucleosidase
MTDQKQEAPAMHDDLFLSPPAAAAVSFTDPVAAVAHLEKLYAQATQFLGKAFAFAVAQGKPTQRLRAYYPEIRLTVTSHD